MSAELIARLEKAEGPDRSLNVGIAHEVGLYSGNNGKWFYPDGGRVPGGLPRYTASLDAALTLVPEEWGWCVGDVHPPTETYLDAGRPWAEIWKRGGPTLHLAGMLWDGIGRNGINAATPALALCIAALTARKETA